MGLPSFLPGGLSAALPRSCLSAVFAQSVGGAGYSVVKVQLGGKKSPSTYSDIYAPESQGIRERFLKFLSLIRK